MVLKRLNQSTLTTPQWRQRHRKRAQHTTEEAAMDEAKRILILVADLGFGHRAAAKAISNALAEKFGEDALIETANPMSSELAPSFLRDTPDDYDRFVRELPELYQLTYQVSGTAMVSSIYESAFVLMLLPAMIAEIDRFKPDVIVVTQENYLAPLNAMMALRSQRIPIVTIITDLTTLHRMWFNEVSTLTIVPTQIAYDLALLNGLPKQKVRTIGIPVNTALANEQRSKAELRSALGWEHDVTTLLFVGSKRTRQFPDVLRALNHCALPLQLCIVAGGDEETYPLLRGTDWHVPAHVYNFVDNLPMMLHAADAVVCKAGGLIVSEALACGLPILLTDVIEGQETGNADYVVTNGAGVRVGDPVEALEAVFHWLQNDGEQLQGHARHSRKLGHPRAAYEIANLIWKAAQNGV
jgi:1,2-diacylglycerol 3-beta-galactosyltransferase